ncbi:MAG: protein kinase, partial [Polyangiaceae bacterium]|nr:protein kinase [Polyangiaceae bacterium]
MHTPAPCPVRPARHLGEHLAGRRFGPLRLLRPLGQGGFAPVWLAEETFGGKRLREVAVKLFFLPEELAPASQEADRWRDSVAEEARALCRVEHPNVVRLYSLQRDDQQAIVGLVMEHVPGASLEALLAGAGPLEEAAVVEAGISVAWALAAVHDAGLVHRDVKPA